MLELFIWTHPVLIVLESCAQEQDMDLGTFLIWMRTARREIDTRWQRRFEEWRDGARIGPAPTWNDVAEEVRAEIEKGESVDIIRQNEYTEH